MQLNRPIQTRFRYASTYRLKLAAQTNSLTHYTKGTPSPRKAAPTACRHPVSGSVSLPSSGCFSPFPYGTGSLSVTEEYLGLEGGPPIFRQDFTCPALLKDRISLTRTGLSPALADLSRSFRLLPYDHWPGPRSLATTYGVSLMSFPSGTEMFHFPEFASTPYGFRRRYPKRVGCPIRKCPDQSLLAAPRTLSQRATSFIASQCQGIHQMPFLRLIVTGRVTRRGKPNTKTPR